MISVEEAIERILAGVHPLEVVQVPLADALGRVLAQDMWPRRIFRLSITPPWTASRS